MNQGPNGPELWTVSSAVHVLEGFELISRTCRGTWFAPMTIRRVGSGDEMIDGWTTAASNCH